MPPRHAYWTIIVDDRPTAFRAAQRDELLPTFERLRRKHPSAALRWFARGRLWDSPDAARQRPAPKGGVTGDRAVNIATRAKDSAKSGRRAGVRCASGHGRAGPKRFAGANRPRR